MSADHDDIAEAQRLLNAMVAQRRAAGVRGDPVVQVAELRRTLRALVDALPRCDNCPAPATRARRRGEGRWCDGHAPEGCPEYPRAAPLRAALALLAGAP
jgi:hypothetical protein